MKTLTNEILFTASLHRINKHVSRKLLIYSRLSFFSPSGKPDPIYLIASASDQIQNRVNPSLGHLRQILISTVLENFHALAKTSPTPQRPKKTNPLNKSFMVDLRSE